MRNLPALLYYVNMNTHNEINCKHLQVIIVHFYGLTRFHIWRCFSASLSIMVSDSGHPVTYTWKYLQTWPFTNYTTACQKSTHEIIGFYIIIGLYIQRHFSRKPFTRARKYCPRQNYHIIHCDIHVGFTRHSQLLDTIQK